MNKNSYSEIRKKFYDSFYKLIVPKAKKFEAERKNIKILIKKLMFMTLFVSLVFSYFFGIDTNGNFSYSSISLTVFMILCIISIGFCCIVNIIKKKDLENDVKTEIMPLFCQSFPNLNWSEFAVVDLALLQASNIILDLGLYVNVDDVFYGEHSGVKFEITELKVTAEKNLGFRGVLVKLDMNKNFSGNTVMYSKGTNKAQNISGIKKLKKIALEDVNLMKKYDVYGEDEVEARYLFNTGFIERLNKMKVAFRAINMSVSFYQNHLFLGFENIGDLFNIADINQPIDDSKQYFVMYEEIVSIIKLIDHFKLDQKTGL